MNLFLKIKKSLKFSSFFLYFSQSILSVRPDLDNTWRETSTTSFSGTTCTDTFDSSDVVYCPDNTWAYGFKLAYYRTSSDDYGVLNIVLDCRGQTYDATNQVWSTTTSQIAQYSNMGDFGGLALNYTNFGYCDGYDRLDFIFRLSLKGWCPPTLIENPQAIYEITMICYDSHHIVSDLQSHPDASWTSYSSCPFQEWLHHEI